MKCWMGPSIDPWGTPKMTHCLLIFKQSSRCYITPTTLLLYIALFSSVGFLLYLFFNVLLVYISVLSFLVKNGAWLPLKGATKLYFRHYSFAVFILFNTGLCKSPFSTNSFGKLVFHYSALFVFSACYMSNLMQSSLTLYLHNLCLYRCQVIIVFVLIYEKQFVHVIKGWV